MSTDMFFDLEPEIVARLREKLPAGVQVLTAEDLVGVQESAQPTPAVHVIYNGYSVTQSQPTAAMTRQRYLVVAVVKHGGAASKAAAEAKVRAAPLVRAVIDALMGWRPDLRPGTPRVVIASPPLPAHRHPYHYFPSLFTADVPVTSRSNANG